MRTIPPFFMFFAIIAFAVAVRLLIGRLNHSRIRRYIADQGGEALGISWQPFGAGWFGEKDSVIYRVRYRDSEGNVREAQCKTGLFSGVYFSKDIVVRRAALPAATARQGAVERAPKVIDQATGTDRQSLLFELRRLKEENALLRSELERLRR